MISCKRQLLLVVLITIDLAFSLSSTSPVAFPDVARALLSATVNNQSENNASALAAAASSNPDSTSSSTQQQQTRSTTTQSSFTTGIVILVLSLILLCIFFVVFFHYRSIRLLPDEPTNFQPTALPKRKIIIKPNLANNKMGAKNSVSTATDSGGSSSQNEQPPGGEQRRTDLDKINAISSNKMNMSTTFRTAEAARANMFELKCINQNSAANILEESLSSIQTDSNDSVYTSIDNTSEMDLIELQSDDGLLNCDDLLSETTDMTPATGQCGYEYDSLINAGGFGSEGVRRKNRTTSYENFVLIEQNPAAFELANASQRKSNTARFTDECGGQFNSNKSFDSKFRKNKELIILNVMNVKKMRNEEKSYL